jgi:glycosyltransferase involved in cell wall biosynthesis
MGASRGASATSAPASSARYAGFTWRSDNPGSDGDPINLLRVGIDGRAFSSPAPGIRRYVAGLVRALLALDEPLDLIALGGEAHRAAAAGLVHVAESAHPPTNVGWALVGLPRAARRAGVDVIHAPAYTGPWWSPAPVVLTIHDVSYERHPEWYPYRNDWLRRSFYRGSAASASHILTVSAFSASEIAAAYGIAAERISVTPLGIDESFRGQDSPALHELPARVVQPFVLHVGDLHERRNLAMVVDAVLAARQRFSSPAALSLVAVGADRGVVNGLCAIAARGDAPDAVVHLKSVSERHLQALYRHAVALVYPSLYEGFGLPLIEAMASGAPVIASTAASIPEVVGDAALLLDPLDREGWTDAIVRVANDHETRDRLRAAGLRRATAFTWERTAQLTLEAYRRVA